MPCRDLKSFDEPVSSRDLGLDWSRSLASDLTVAITLASSHSAVIGVEPDSTECGDEREKCSVRQVNMTISLAFLAPNLVKAAVEGRLPRGIGVERLRDPPTEWSRQFEALGLNPE